MFKRVTEQQTWFKTDSVLTSLLVGVLFWDPCPVDSDFFKVVKERSDLFLYVGLRDEDMHICEFVFLFEFFLNVSSREFYCI